MLFLKQKSFTLYIHPVVLFLLGSIIFINSCKSSKKSRNQAFDKVKTEEEGPVYNKWQNFTTKYNVLFNAHQMIEQESDAIFHGANKNFQIRQTVFDEPVGEGDAHKLMDSLVQKAYKIVNNKQESKYVNEAYLVIGKANYLKGAYHTSIEFFNHLLRSAAQDQREYLPLAYAWKSRALLQINKADAAKVAVDSAMVTLDEEKATRTFVNAAMANYQIKSGNELAAIPYLEYALESNSKRLDENRWMFLLAQLYKDNGQQDKAYAYFDKISKRNVPFDMAFESGLQAAFLEGGKYQTVAERIKPLKRMLREGKNDGYQDQILYQIGDIVYSSGEKEQGIKYFKESLAQLKRNNYQATESYLRLAEHYFENEKFYLAQQYFDSVATVLPADYTDVNKVRRKLGYMNEITELYQEISWQDTLLQLAALNENDLNIRLDTFANQQLSAYKIDLAKKEKLAKQSKKKGGSASSSNSISSLPAQSAPVDFSGGADRTFYFNNTDELLLGQNSFKRRWGSRQLKDNWRYEPSTELNLATSQAVVQTGTDSLQKKEDFDEGQFVTQVKEKYLKDIPKNKEDYDASHKIVHDKLIVIGNIYRDYTRDNHDAIKVYEEFLKRYPNTEAGAEILYSLYRMYDGTNKAKSNEYLIRLVSLYPNSLHAKVAQDPAYMDKIKRDKNLLDRIFEKLFNLYASGDHAAVIREADIDLKNRFENTALVAQVEYLRALAIGRVGRVDDFTVALNDIVKKYPNDSLVTTLAKENIVFIEKNPQYFVNRVNALQDIDKSRIAFVDEPDMTAWPSLSISGDYRSGKAIVREVPKPKVEPKKEEIVKVDPPKVEKPKEVVIVKKEEVAKADPPKVEVAKAEPVKETVVAKVEPKKEVVEVKVEEKKEEEVKKSSLEALEGGTKIAKAEGLNTDVTMTEKKVAIENSKFDFGPNDYRDKKLFPDTAEYYFTINVIDAKVNLAPSRYGIGQFNRTRYQQQAINHQLRVVNGENQLVFVGPFKTFEEVKLYESRILPLMSEIMKVPVDIYNTFVIAKEIIPTLTDGVEINKYHQNYIEQ